MRRWGAHLGDGNGDDFPARQSAPDDHDDPEMNVSLGNDTAKSLSEQILFNIQLYYTPVLVILGTLGNCLSVFVFFYTKLRKLSSSYYLAALALSDTVVLLTVFYIWLTLIDVTDFNTPVKCQLMVFITYVSSFLSSWFVVAFTVERFIAVQFPLRRPSMCTVTRAKIVLVFLTMFAVLAYSPYSIIAGIVTREDGHKTCQPYPEFKFINTLYHHFDMLVTFLLPFLVISVLNAWIGRTVLRVEIDRSRLTTRSRGNHERLRPASAHTKVTKMLLIVSTCFLLLNFPSYVIRTIIFFTVSIITYIGILVHFILLTSP